MVVAVEERTVDLGLPRFEVEAGAVAVELIAGLCSLRLGNEIEVEAAMGWIVV